MRKEALRYTPILCAVRWPTAPAVALILPLLAALAVDEHTEVSPASAASGPAFVVGAPVMIARGATSDATASNNAVKLLRTGGLLVAAYAGGAGSTPQILLAASRDGGARWSPLAQASEGGVPSRLAALAVDGSGHLHVVWTRYDGGVGKIYYREWAPVRGGLGTWEAPQLRISPGNNYAGFPSIALDRAGRPQVLWYGIREGQTPVPTKHGSIYEILYTGFDGRAWSRAALISSGVPDSINPALASDFAGRLHAVWYQYNGRVYQIRYAEYASGWAAPEGVSRTSSDEFNPDVAADGQGRLNLVWEQHDVRGSTIDYARRTGGTWGAPAALSDAVTPAYHPSVATDATGAIWAAWDADDGQIYARRFKNGWGPALRLTADADNAYPSVFADAGALDVIWTHTGTAGAAVYFARVTARP
ncbi:MAG TPA: hypothetical protein VJT33_01240 [bacterium]|nr:hypothetical protein [bacterium]